MTEPFRVELIEELTADSTIGVGLAQCWFDVSNAGGAVGFPSLPVERSAVDAATDRLARDVASGLVSVFVAVENGVVVGWVSLRRNLSPVARHWAMVERLQSHPLERGRGIGRALMRAVTERALAEGIEQLRLALRGAEGLEAFYEQLGWVEIGRHPRALRIDGVDRDEVMMLLPLVSS